jgi:DNA-binding MurR/RpiR family transcriptional regulator
MYQSQVTPLIILQIKNIYPEFNPAMKQIADYILSLENKIIYMGITQLAEASKVSVASVTRFVKKLGFSSFKSFQFELAKSFINGDDNDRPQNPDNRIVFEYGGTSSQDTIEEITKKVFQSNIQMLSDTLQIIDYNKLERVVDQILNARNLVFIGIGRSFVTAESGRIRFSRLGISSFSYADAPEQIVAATTCDKRDVFFGISNYGRSVSVVNNMYHAKQRGAATIGITSVESSPLTQVVDTYFLTAFNSANMGLRIQNQANEPACENIAQIALLDSIYMNVALRMDKSVFDMFYNTIKVLAKDRL